MITNSAVSVIIPTYNREIFLPRAIDSVLPQLQSSDELIIIDDGSTDDTRKVLDSYGTALRYYRTEHLGTGGARNAGIQKARNPFLAFLDSDDEWLPHKLDIQRNFLKQKPNIAFCYSNMRLKRKDGLTNHFSLNNWPGVDKNHFSAIGTQYPISSILDLPPGIEDFPVYIGSIYHMLATGLYANVFTLLVNKEMAGNAFWFPTDLAMYEDWEFFGRLSQAETCAYMHCETAIQHTHLSPRLTDADAYQRALARVKILNRIWGKDENYLLENENEYKMLLNEEFITIINYYIENANVVEARRYFSKLFHAPIYQRGLLLFPNQISVFLGKFLFAFRRRIARIISSTFGIR